MNAPVKNIEEKSSGHLFDYLALLVVIAGLVLFYVLNINIWLKWGIVVVTLAAAGILFYVVSPTGKGLHGYVHDSWRELGKVVWPTRKEAMQFSWIVLLFVLVLGLFLWLVDTALAWILYGVILGKGG